MTITTSAPALAAHAIGGTHAFRPLTRSGQTDASSIPAAMRSEWIKFWSIRSNPAILGASAVIGVLLSWILATFVKTDPDTHEVFTIAQTFIFSTWLSTVLAAITGTLMFTSELQHGTLSNAVTAQPARWVTVSAKATIAAAFGLAMGVVGMLAGFSGAVLGGLDKGDTSGVVTTALCGLLLTTLAAVFGLGVGMIIRHSSAAVSTLLVWAFVLENLLRAIAAPKLSRFLPFSAANGLLGITTAGDNAETLAARLSRVHDAFLFGGYTIAAIVIGTALLYRRDTN